MYVVSVVDDEVAVYSICKLLVGFYDNLVWSTLVCSTSLGRRRAKVLRNSITQYRAKEKVKAPLYPDCDDNEGSRYVKSLFVDGENTVIVVGFWPNPCRIVYKQAFMVSSFIRPPSSCSTLVESRWHKLPITESWDSLVGNNCPWLKKSSSRPFVPDIMWAN